MSPQPDLSKPTVAILNGLVNPIPPIKGGGPQIVIWNTCQFLADAPFDWRVLTLYDPQLDDSTAENERIIQVKNNKFERFILRIIKHFPDRIVKGIFGVIRQDHLGLNLAMITALRKINPDLIIVHDSYSLAFLCHLVFPTKPLAFYHHNSKMQEDLSEKRWNRLVRSANAGIISICQSAFEATDRAYKIQPNNKWVILNGVNENLIRQASMIRFNCGSNFNEVNKEIVFLYVGRITPIKGIDLLIQVAGELIEKSPVPVRFVIVGSAGIDEGGNLYYERQMRDLAEDLGQGKIQFTGFVPNEELGNFYRISDFGVLPTQLLEGNSLFMMECLTFGLPVIATRKGGVPEVVRDGKDGVLLDEERLETELAPTLLKFIEEHELWESKRSEIAKSAAERFSYGRVAHEFEQVVLEILKPKTTRGQNNTDSDG